MVALQIRDVPDAVRDTLAGVAAARGQSLQAYLLALVTEEARRADNLALLEGFGARADGSHLTLEEVGETVEQARIERDARLSEALEDLR